MAIHRKFTVPVLNSARLTHSAQGLTISQGTKANGHGTLSKRPCAYKISLHIFPAEVALKMGALQFSYVNRHECFAKLTHHFPVIGRGLCSILETRQMWPTYL
jgi:hypothetical protein